MDQEYIVFEGKEFTIEWYYTSTGKSPAKEYFDKLDRDRQMDAFTLFKTMANIGQIRNIQKFRHEGDKIYAFSLLEKKLLSLMLLKINKINCLQLKSEKHKFIKKIMN